MSKTTTFGSVTDAKLNDIYKKEPHIYKVQTNWYAGDVYVQYDYIYVLTTLTHDQLAYYLVHDYDLPVWSTDHGYADDLTAGFRIDRFEPKVESPFSKTINIYHELLNEKQSNSVRITKLVIMDPDHEKLAHDPKYTPNYYITETDNWEDSLKYLAALRDQEIKKMQKKHEQEKANRQMSEIIKQISKMSIDKKQEILKQLIK